MSHAPELLPPIGTAIATAGDVVRKLARLFPKHAEILLEWADGYQRVLGHLGPNDLAAAFARIVDHWDKTAPPKPAEFAETVERVAMHGQRHPLNLSSEELFGKPMGNGREIPDLGEREFAEWQHQNGELFQQRLGAWRRMRITMGDDEAARVLKAARTPETIWAAFDEYLQPGRDAAMREAAARGDRQPSAAALEHAKAYDHAMACGYGWPPARAAMVEPALQPEPEPLI